MATWGFDGGAEPVQPPSMSRTLRFLALVLPLTVFVLPSCGDDANPYELTIETFNVGLAGAFVPNEAERRDPVIAAVAGMEADVVCLQEVWQQADKDRVLAAVAESFPHTVSFTHDYETPIDDATDQNGMVPPPPTMAPCGNAMLETQLEAVIECLSTNCSTMPGSDMGQTTSADCAQESCLSAVTPLLVTGGDEGLRCYSCMTTSLPTENFGDMRNLCTTELNADVAFRGQSGVMILSKHPISNERAFVLPGTWNRRIVAEATVTLPNGTDVDVYCNHLTPIFDSLAFPYTGDYGDGLDGADGWAAEQLLQTERLVARVAANSGSRPAFVLGDMNAGRAAAMVENEGLPTVQALEAAFALTATTDYEPLCTFCPDNGNNVEDTLPVWIDHIWMANVDRTAVSASQRTFVESTVSTPEGMVPLSDHYGFQATVTID